MKVPAVTKRRRLNNSGGEKLYRLKVIEEDETRGRLGLVKVSYLGYGSHCDEWRPKSDIIDLSERKESEARENVSEDVSMIGKALAKGSFTSRNFVDDCWKFRNLNQKFRKYT